MNIRHSLYEFFLVIIKILLGCLLGCAVVLFFASKSEIVHQEIIKSVQTMFKDDLHADWDGELESIDLLFLQVKFRHISMLPSNRSDGWTFYADSFHMSASWLYFLWHGKFSCHSFFEQVVVHETQTDGRSPFMEFIARVSLLPVSHSMSFDFIGVKQAHMIIQDEVNQIEASYEYNCQMSRESDGMHTKLYIIDGNFLYKNIKIIENFFGNFLFVFPYNNDLAKMYARADCRLLIPKLQEKGSCFFKGDLFNSRGAFIISNDDQSFIIEPLKFRLKKNSIPMTCSVTIASDLVQKLLLDEITMPDVTGDVTLIVTGNLLNLASGLQGKVQLQNISYKHNNLFDRACVDFYKEKNGYAAKFFVNSTCIAQGNLKPASHGWKFNVVNSIELSPWWTSYWKMPEKKGVIFGTFDTSCTQMKGDYHFMVESIKLDDQASVEGRFICNPEQFSLYGSFLDQKFEMIFAVSPTPHLVSLRYYSENETFINFHEDINFPEKTIGFIGFNCIKNMLPEQYKSSFSQPGKIDMSGYVRQGSYCADAATENAYIRIPSFYNVMQSFKAGTELNFIDRSITLHNFVANLYDGKVYCDHAIALFDAESKLSFLHAPMFLDSVLMSWYKGIFGVVSGRIFLSLKDYQQPLLQGNLILDKTQLKGNIFSAEFQDHLLGTVSTTQPIESDCNLDVSIQTKEPIAIETSFLQATAHLDFHITNTIKKPVVQGSINLVSGELKFPYKSLFITHGQVVILPKSSSEPTIEFVAKGKIKNYNITMRASGTMMDQQIHFDASPYLTEEQIISLLLIGSQDSSLSAVMPAMFMQKLHEIIFGPAISKTKLDIIFNRLLQSFKNIRIYPQFTNQTGRGGVRGVIEVDATDRLHGKIDTNLMQLEDTIFEADYSLTDDVTVRAIKDGPSTYGGEVEMRWKFS